MILFDFRYQDPWAEDTIVFPNFIEQTQAQQRQDQQAEINTSALRTGAINITRSDICYFQHTCWRVPVSLGLSAFAENGA